MPATSSLEPEVAPRERLRLASQARTSHSQREPEQQAVAQWEERPA